ncbi:general secretion pathway protein GspG [bacterium (candidate division B38) B3_B38]|nr:MAG: general secretion pathway protein GspG [bacterium (candidate division B38) B3_B38]
MIKVLASKINMRGSTSAFTLAELMVVVAIISVLAASILPVARIAIKRAKEVELRENLRIIRRAIDEYKKMVDLGQITAEFGSEGYPPDLQALVEGVEEVGKLDVMKKFLRRIPRDPMTNSTDWEMRSYQDDFDSTSWGGENVFDVYSKSEGIALDGTKYKDW